VFFPLTIPFFCGWDRYSLIMSNPPACDTTLVCCLTPLA
jgi:hypothetical protein